MSENKQATSSIYTHIHTYQLTNTPKTEGEKGQKRQRSQCTCKPVKKRETEQKGGKGRGQRSRKKGEEDTRTKPRHRSSLPLCKVFLSSFPPQVSRTSSSFRSAFKSTANTKLRVVGPPCMLSVITERSWLWRFPHRLPFIELQLCFKNENETKKQIVQLLIFSPPSNSP